MARLHATSYTVGERVEYKGQTYTFKGKEPYTRLDGVETNLDCWSTACLSCGVLIEVKTSETHAPFSPLRRCRACVKAWRADRG